MVQKEDSLLFADQSSTFRSSVSGTLTLEGLATLFLKAG